HLTAGDEPRLELGAARALPGYPARVEHRPDRVEFLVAEVRTGEGNRVAHRMEPGTNARDERSVPNRSRGAAPDPARRARSPTIPLDMAENEATVQRTAPVTAPETAPAPPTGLPDPVPSQTVASAPSSRFKVQTAWQNWIRPAWYPALAYF